MASSAVARCVAGIPLLAKVGQEALDVTAVQPVGIVVFAEVQERAGPEQQPLGALVVDPFGLECRSHSRERFQHERPLGAGGHPPRRITVGTRFGEINH